MEVGVNASGLRDQGSGSKMRNARKYRLERFGFLPRGR